MVESKYGDNSIPTAAYKPGSVDAVALSGNAVETVKIKDRNVTAAKIELDSIDHDLIKANAIRGTEIQNGAVGFSELSDNAVQTPKILDRAVTLAKLQVDILRGLLQPRQLIYDDFLGATLRPEWASSGDPGGSVAMVASEILIRTNALDDNKYRVNFGGNLGFALAEDARVFLRGRQNITLVHVRFGLYSSANDYILFDLDTDVDGNWHVKTKKEGNETDTDTGIAATDVLHEFLIEVNSPSAVLFSIDGIPEVSHGTNLPVTLLEPWMEIQNRSADIRRFTVDKYLADSDKAIGEPPP
ncbi:hypothetical protein ES707_22367 [subsurface metagenome]